MSAGAQIQMAPQASVTATQPAHSQDSNMSTGNNIKFNFSFDMFTFRYLVVKL